MDCETLHSAPYASGYMSLPYAVDKNVDMFCEDLVNYCEVRLMGHLADRKKGYESTGNRG